MLVKIGKFQLHFGEEPCISGKRGSGTVFFSGCRLGCVFCQNEPISHRGVGELADHVRLAEIFRKLENAGAHNINLVTGEHFVDAIIEAFQLYRPNIPVVWNTSGYESVETLKKLEDYVDVYLPDFKYADNMLAGTISNRSDYPEVAFKAIKEMLRQKGNPVFCEDESSDECGMIQKGVIIRHLVLPLHIKNTEGVLQIIKNSFADAWISLMLQYTPVVHSDTYPELNRTLTRRECEKALRLLEESGLENGYFQDISAATTELIPKFEKD